MGVAQNSGIGVAELLPQPRPFQRYPTRCGIKKIKISTWRVWLSVGVVIRLNYCGVGWLISGAFDWHPTWLYKAYRRKVWIWGGVVPGGCGLGHWITKGWPPNILSFPTSPHALGCDLWIQSYGGLFKGRRFFWLLEQQQQYLQTHFSSAQVSWALSSQMWRA